MAMSGKTQSFQAVCEYKLINPYNSVLAAYGSNDWNSKYKAVRTFTFYRTSLFINFRGEQNTKQCALHDFMERLCTSKLQ